MASKQSAATLREALLKAQSWCKGNCCYFSGVFDIDSGNREGTAECSHKERGLTRDAGNEHRGEGQMKQDMEDCRS